MEAEYIASGQCCAQILWMVHQLGDYELFFKNVKIMCDDCNDICLSKIMCTTLGISILT